jgi:hypothetical protein
VCSEYGKRWWLAVDPLALEAYGFGLYSSCNGKPLDDLWQKSSRIGFVVLEAISATV